MTPQEIAVLARSSLRGLRLQAADADDCAQEAALGMLRKMKNLRPDASEGEARGYLFKVGCSKALSYLQWRARSPMLALPRAYDLSSVDALGGESFSLQGTLDRAQAKVEAASGIPAVPSPESEASVVGIDAAIELVARIAAKDDDEDAEIVVDALNLGLSRLGSQEAALFRHKLGVEEMRDDLVALGKGPRGSVSNRARAKLLKAATELGVDGLLNADVLLAVFGSKKD